MTIPSPTARFAFQALRSAFVLVPLLSGFDKLSGVLVDWNRYVSPTVAAWLPVPVEYALYAVGLLEIFMALLVIAAPRLGGYVLSGWFGASVCNFALMGESWHIAFRDLGLAVGALALAAFSKLPELDAGAATAKEARSRPRGRARSPRSDTLVSASDE